LLRFRDEHTISPELQQRFAQTLRAADSLERETGGPGLEARWIELCGRFGYYRQQWPKEWKRDRADLVSELRALLARACIDALEPDLVILDEFQRFKHLLDPELGDEAAFLARQLFDWQDETAQARVLLLSATPYKMYTLSHEAEEDDHYRDFLRTVEFL
jgi:hypothetical protein